MPPPTKLPIQCTSYSNCHGHSPHNGGLLLLATSDALRLTIFFMPCYIAYRQLKYGRDSGYH